MHLIPNEKYKFMRIKAFIIFLVMDLSYVYYLRYNGSTLFHIKFKTIFMTNTKVLALFEAT